MCEYCRRVLDEEFEDEWNCIVNDTIYAKINNHTDVPILNIDMILSGDCEEPYIYYSVDNPLSSGEALVERIIPIRYCPFCGEKLKKNES